MKMKNNKILRALVIVVMILFAGYMIFNAVQEYKRDTASALH